MTRKLISSIHIRGLFGLYDYDLPDGGPMSDAAILYGDNGVGKSTILRLVFHLLSSSNDGGHRTALYETEFKSLTVKLSSNTNFHAEFKQANSEKILILTILKGSKKVAIWKFAPKKHSEVDIATIFQLKDGKVVRVSHSPQKEDPDANVPQGQEIYLSTLLKEAPTIYILNSDRRLDGDSIADPSDELELRRAISSHEPKKFRDLVIRAREISLSQALGSATKWIGKKAVIGTNQGSTNVHSVYTSILGHLLSPVKPPDEIEQEISVQTLKSRLAAIEFAISKHAIYELATKLSTTEFQKALSATDPNTRKLAAQVINPYIKSLESRLEAVDPIYTTIDRFVSTINNLLRDKELKFSLSQGFSIDNKLGNPLTPSQLSSGEQQLLLLFCRILVARDQSSIFMIDEPEISLNVKWQRQLIQSMLDITDGADIQFIFASHSMELLAQHRNRVVKLQSKI